MRTRHFRPGFTLFGLLIVLSGLGLLTALFFPALLRIREASQRMKAASNMRQLGIGLHNYHFQENGFPTIGKGKKSSWCYEIAVYVELDPKAAGFEKTPSSVFYNPARRKAALYNELPKTDFAGCTGNCDDPGKPDKEGRGAFHTTAATLEAMTGADGTSNTILLGPKRLRTSEYLTGKGKGDEDSCWTGGTSDTLRSTKGDKRGLVQDNDEADDGRGFGSPFRDVCPFVMTDGSVRSYSYKIKPADFKEICNWDGGVIPKVD